MRVPISSGICITILRVIIKHVSYIMLNGFPKSMNVGVRLGNKPSKRRKMSYALVVFLHVRPTCKSSIPRRQSSLLSNLLLSLDHSPFTSSFTLVHNCHTTRTRGLTGLKLQVLLYRSQPSQSNPPPLPSDPIQSSSQPAHLDPNPVFIWALLRIG